MRQVYYHYTKWEDFQNGMYNEVKEGRADRVRQAATLLADTELLYEQMTRVTKEWTYATEQNFTDNSINHQAFLGQTACNIYAGIKEDETREAWGTLTNEQRYKANKVADRVYSEWRHAYEREHDPFYQISLFDEVEA